MNPHPMLPGTEHIRPNVVGRMIYRPFGAHGHGKILAEITLEGGDQEHLYIYEEHDGGPQGYLRAATPDEVEFSGDDLETAKLNHPAYRYMRFNRA